MRTPAGPSLTTISAPGMSPTGPPRPRSRTPRQAAGPPRAYGTARPRSPPPPRWRTGQAGARPGWRRPGPRPGPARRPGYRRADAATRSPPASGRRPPPPRGRAPPPGRSASTGTGRRATARPPRRPPVQHRPGQVDAAAGQFGGDQVRGRVAAARRDQPGPAAQPGDPGGHVGGLAPHPHRVRAGVSVSSATGPDTRTTTSRWASPSTQIVPPPLGRVPAMPRPTAPALDRTNYHHLSG